MSSVAKPSLFSISKRAVNFRPRCPSCTRALHDGRNRLTAFWTPTAGLFDKYKTNGMDSNTMLGKAGFIRPAYSGIFQLLPLGLRVQEKLERLIDKHMRPLGASKISLSSLSSSKLWEKSGRLKKSSEFFKFHDRKDTEYLLSPTHEEEITTIVASLVHSYKDLPLRLYQISRKYRDERRPREGLLRGREFLMKDLYTFDYSTSEAMKTYNEVRDAYSSFFRELKIPFLVAEADSGNMGGNLSHEYHIPSGKGEDNIISCSSCDYVANEELAESGSRPTAADGADGADDGVDLTRVVTWKGITVDALTSVYVHYPRLGLLPARKPRHDQDINLHLLRSLVPSIDLIKIIDMDSSDARIGAKPMKLQTIQSSLKEIHIFDHGVPSSYRDKIRRNAESHAKPEYLTKHPVTGRELNMRTIRSGDPCPRCSSGSLKTTLAIELGHTFFLGTRYSSIFDAKVSVDPVLLPLELGLENDVQIEQGVGLRKTDRRRSEPTTSTTAVVPLQMGCHGIGVSRMIAAVADNLADSRGLNWPRLIAPFEVVVLQTPGSHTVAEQIYDDLTKPVNGEALDAILDNRDRALPWKLSDADLIGYPVIVVLGKTWKMNGTVEVQCRRLGIKESVLPEKLHGFVDGLLKKL